MYNLLKRQCAPLFLYSQYCKKSEIQTVILQLVDQVAQNVNIVGSDDIGRNGNLLDLALVGISHTGQEVQQTTGDLLIGRLQIQHHGALLTQMLCDLGYIVKPVGRDQDHLELRGGVADYTEQVFKMFSGTPADVVLEFSSNLIGVVYDKFGESTKMIRVNENTCIATVKIQESPTFWGWLFQFAGQMKILSPDGLAKEYIRRAELVCGEPQLVVTD